MGLFGAKREDLLRKALTRGDVVTLTESETKLFDAGTLMSQQVLPAANVNEMTSTKLV